MVVSKTARQTPGRRPPMPALLGLTVLFAALLGALVTLSVPALAQETSAEAIVFSVLPTSRAVVVGDTATAFATATNAGSEDAVGCSLAPQTVIPANFSFQTTDPATNEPTGFPDTPVDIPAGAAQSFVFSLEPTEPIAPTEVEFTFDCANTDPAPLFPGVNTFLFSAWDMPVPDIIALAVTLGGQGVTFLPESGAFAVATSNVGIDGTITATADTGGANLPVTIKICRTNESGFCLNPPVDATLGVTSLIEANSTPSFAVFVSSNETIAFDPAVNRVFVHFGNALGELGGTSVAVRTFEFPDVTGSYESRASSLTHNAECPLQLFGGNTLEGMISEVDILSQVGPAFEATFSLNFGWLTLEGELAGAMTPSGILSGGFESETSPVILDGTAEGTFTGSLIGDTVEIQLSGQYVSEDDCNLAASILVCREPDGFGRCPSAAE
jgi:hypothetical protein